MSDKLKLNPLITIKIYAEESLDHLKLGVKETSLFLVKVVALILIPIWYPILYIIAQVTYPKYLKKVAEAKSKQMDRLFPNRGPIDPIDPIDIQPYKPWPKPPQKDAD